MKLTGDVVDHIQFAVVIGSEADDLQRGVAEFSGFGQFCPVVSGGPDLSGDVIAVDVGSVE